MEGAIQSSKKKLKILERAIQSSKKIAQNDLRKSGLA
jgi:hypothetical protein